MNPYFMVFALYALIISPVTLHASVRIGRGVRYRILLQFSGLPVINRSFDGERQREKRVKDRDVAGALKPDTFRAAKAIAHSQAVRHLPRLFRWEGLHVRVRLSFDDAAATALSFAGLHAVANVARALAPNAPLTRIGAVCAVHSQRTFGEPRIRGHCSCIHSDGGQRKTKPDGGEKLCSIPLTT